jgi:hypothetical protein
MNDTTTEAQVPAIAKPKKPPMAADGTGVMPIIPRDAGQAVAMAQALANAEMVPDAYRFDGKRNNAVNTSLVAAGILKALEIGLPPQTGLGSLLPMNGRFTVWGDGAQALVQQAGVVDNHKVEKVGTQFDAETVPLDRWPADYGYRVSYWRKGQTDPYVSTFTVADARRAGLWNSAVRKPWILYPDRMLFNRARAFVLRDGFADCLYGLQIAEEMRDTMDATERGRRVDNSALDDDSVTIPALVRHEPNAAEREDLVRGYLAGLPPLTSLEALQEYQTRDEHVRLLNLLQQDDEETYKRLIAANAERFQQIDKAEQETQRATDEARLQSEDAAAATDTAGQGDLLGGDQ